MDALNVLAPTQSHSRLPVPVRFEARPLRSIQPVTGNRVYREIGARIASFYNSAAMWPKVAPIGPREMAEAGLFYTGLGDKVQCAYCDGKLYNWKVTDSPSREHRKHFPRCLGTPPPPPMAENPRRKCIAVESLLAIGYDRRTILRALGLVDGPVTVLALLDASFKIENEEEVRELEEERVTLKTMVACRVCLVNDASVITFPCRELVYCEMCATTTDQCPSCNGDVIGWLKIFL